MVHQQIVDRGANHLLKTDITGVGRHFDTEWKGDFDANVEKIRGSGVGGRRGRGRSEVQGNLERGDFDAFFAALNEGAVKRIGRATIFRRNEFDNGDFSFSPVGQSIMDEAKLLLFSGR